MNDYRMVNQRYWILDSHGIPLGAEVASHIFFDIFGDCNFGIDILMVGV